jgi:hypothetical protein
MPKRQLRHPAECLLHCGEGRESLPTSMIGAPRGTVDHPQFRADNTMVHGGDPKVGFTGRRRGRRSPIKPWSLAAAEGHPIWPGGRGRGVCSAMKFQIRYPAGAFFEEPRGGYLRLGLGAAERPLSQTGDGDLFERRAVMVTRSGRSSVVIGGRLPRGPGCRRNRIYSNPRPWLSSSQTDHRGDAGCNSQASGIDYGGSHFLTLGTGAALPVGEDARRRK